MTIKVGRDSKTGEFIDVKKAKKRKTTAQVETIQVGRWKDGQFRPIAPRTAAKTRQKQR